MSRSLGSKVLHKKNSFSYEDEGRLMFERGEPCPSNRGKGKAHAKWRGWMRAAAAKRTELKGKK